MQGKPEQAAQCADKCHGTQTMMSNHELNLWSASVHGPSPEATSATLHIIYIYISLQNKLVVLNPQSGYLAWLHTLVGRLIAQGNLRGSCPVHLTTTAI